MLKAYSEKAKSLQKGFYEHYRGDRYELIDIARHTETLEELAIYRALYGTFDLWARPVEMFTEEVEMEDGTTKPRFRFLGSKI